MDHSLNPSSVASPAPVNDTVGLLGAVAFVLSPLLQAFGNVGGLFAFVAVISGLLCGGRWVVQAWKVPARRWRTIALILLVLVAYAVMHAVVTALAGTTVGL